MILDNDENKYEMSLSRLTEEPVIVDIVDGEIIAYGSKRAMTIIEDYYGYLSDKSTVYNTNPFKMVYRILKTTLYLYVVPKSKKTSRNYSTVIGEV